MPFIRIFGLISAFVVDNVPQQRELEQHESVSPVLSSQGGLLHRVLASRFARDMGLSEGELPALPSVSGPGGDFGADMLPIHSGEIYKMATYVAGGDPREDIEVIVQRWVAKRFSPRYEASAGVRDAARLIGGWHRRGPLTALACIWAGKLETAKALLAASVPRDLHVAYAPASLLPYIVKCLERMRQVARDATVSECLSPELVVAGCLASPRFVFRTCKADVDVSFSTHRLPANTLVILPRSRLRAASDGSIADATDDSGRHPALRLIRRLLTRVWVASREVNHPAAQSFSSVAEQTPAPRTALQRAALQRAALQRAESRRAASQRAERQPLDAGLDPTVVQPIAVQPVADGVFEPHPSEPHSVVQPTLQSMPPDLASLKRTLPYGNDLGLQRQRASERRARKARARSKAAAERTVPGPF